MLTRRSPIGPIAFVFACCLAACSADVPSPGPTIAVHKQAVGNGTEDVGGLKGTHPYVAGVTRARFVDSVFCSAVVRDAALGPDCCSLRHRDTELLGPVVHQR